MGISGTLRTLPNAPCGSRWGTPACAILPKNSKIVDLLHPVCYTISTVTDVV